MQSVTSNSDHDEESDGVEFEQHNTLTNSNTFTGGVSPAEEPEGQPRLVQVQFSSNSSVDGDGSNLDEGHDEGHAMQRRVTGWHAQASTLSVQVGDSMLEDSFLQRFVFLPGSKLRVSWDVVGVLFVAYDGFMIPFMQAFHKTEISTTLAILMLVSTVFWTFDIPITFLTGYYVDGLIEMRMSRIAKRYVRAWLIPDIFIVVLDWLFIAIGIAGQPSASNDNSMGLARIGRTVRVFRMLRIVRLLRLPKLFWKLQEIHARIQSEILRVCFQMWGAMGIMIILTHYVACGWYAVGICMWGDITICADAPQKSWTFAFFDVEAGHDTNILYRYATSMQWAAAQIAVGGSDVMATCTRERCFAVLMIWFGLVVFSVFVSCITTNMTQLRQINSQRFKDEEGLKVYLVERKISVELGRCIMEFFASHRKGQRLQENELDFAVLQSMPERLKKQLSIEIFVPTLTGHPFFRFLKEVDPLHLTKICQSAMTELRLTAAQELFNPGDHSSGLFFITKGIMSYSISIAKEHLQEGQWIAEASLWLSNWLHCGRLVAGERAPVEVVRLDPDCFRKITSFVGNEIGFRFASAYAACFIKHECEGTDPSLFRRTDIWGTRAELVEIASRTAERVLQNWSTQRSSSFAFPGRWSV